MVTHLFNAMSQLGNREPGLVGAALDAEGVRGRADRRRHPRRAGVDAGGAGGEARGGRRSSSSPTRWRWRGPSSTGSTLNGRRILRRDGRLTLADGTLAGADIDFPGAIRVLVREAGATLPRALRMATAAPATVLGRDDLGRLAPGLAADFVHLDAGLALRGVWRAGRPA